MLIIGEILIVSDSEVFKAWKEACANKSSSKLAEFFTEDFRFLSRVRDIGKQETLDWASAGDMALDNLEVVHENDEVAVIHDNVKRGDNDGVSTGVFTMGKHMPEKINSPEVESVIGEFAKSIPGFKE